MRVLALVSKAQGLSPGQRFRLEQWAPYLAADHDIHIDFAPFESPTLTEALRWPGLRRRKALLVARDFIRRAADIAATRRYDAAIVYRETSLLGPALYDRWLARSVPFLIDFDDAIWMSDNIESHNGVFARLRFPSKIATTCQLASGVMVGNEFLARYARRYNPAVTVVPTTIDLRSYPVQPEAPDDGRFVVLWSGSTPTRAHFEVARTALERLATRRKLVVKVICNQPPERPIAGAENVFVPWQQQGEAEALGACHVGIMPLPDNPFSQGKCGLKALQYMAVGRPCVVAPVGMNIDLVRDGENGILARTVDEWTAALERLADDPALRQRIGLAGRRTVEESFCAPAAAALYARELRRITAAPRR